MSRLVFIGVVLGLITSSPTHVRADDAEDKAAAFAKKLGGLVTRDENAPGQPVVRVNLSSSKVTNEGLKELAALRNLTTLDLSNTKITDEGLKELVPLKNLTVLSLYLTKVTD